MQPEFTIITVTYNDLPGLIHTAKSIANQSCHNFEWIVIDGGSVDGTLNYLLKSEHLITKWISEKDQGIYDAMNKGITLSSGKYSVFLNAGDAFLDCFALQKVYGHTHSYSSLPDVVLGGAIYILPNGIELHKAPRDAKKYIWHGVPANHQATFYKSELLKETFYDLAYKICGDYYIAAKMYVKGVVFSYLNVPLVIFKVGGTSYKKPIRLCWESYLIKKHVLHLPLPVRIKSLGKSIISIAGSILLSQPYFYWLAKHVEKKYKHNSSIVGSK